MRLFQCNKKSCELMGIHLSHSKQSCSFDFKTPLILLPNIIFFICSLSFLLFEANSIENYDESFFMTSASMASIANFLNVIWKMPNLLKMIANFEEKIEKSKQKHFKRQL